MEVVQHTFRLATFNCHGLKSSLPYCLNLSDTHDIVFLNEHTIREICEENNKLCYLKSSVDPESTLCGRPHGGTGFICRKAKGIGYKIIQCDSDRLYGLQLLINHHVVMYIYGDYAPYYDGSVEQTELYLEIIDQLQCLVDQTENEHCSAESEMLSDNWYCKKPFTKWSLILYEFLKQNNVCRQFFI